MNTLVNITKALLLSKIDHGLPIYGHCAKTHIKLLHAPYHTAAKRSIRAFPTSPTKVVLAEAGLPDISSRITRNTMMLIPKLLHARNNLFFSQLKTAIDKPIATNKPSTIMRCLTLSKRLNIIATPSLVETPISPTCSSLISSLIKESQKGTKQSTSNSEYQQLHNAAIEPFKRDWEIVYTDGSKAGTSTTFAVTNKYGATIAVYALPSYCSVFTAEAAALLEAVLFASRNGRKTLICTDSKSAIEAVFNQSNDMPMIIKIRNVLLQHTNKIKIMWVPAHVGIYGNELADKRAKEAGSEPLYMADYFTEKDLRILVNKYLKETFAADWRSFSHYYKGHNTTGVKPTYSTNSTCWKISLFVRLRIGHTLETHVHLLNGTSRPNCEHCGSADLTMTHLLDDCPSFHQIRSSIFDNNKPSNYLVQTVDRHIVLIAKYVTLCKLHI